MAERIDTGLEQRIAQAWDEGRGTALIAAQFGVSKTTVLRCIKRNGRTVDPEVVRQRKRRTTPEQDAEIVARYLAGESGQSLAEEYGFVMHLSVIKRVREAGGKVRPAHPVERDLTEAEGETVLRLRNEQGVSQEKIAERLGIAQTRISRFLIANGHRTWELSRHPHFSGGLVRNNGGYLLRRVEETDPLFVMASKNRYIPEHRYVMAQAVGRPLLPTETVHHIDGDRGNNALSNLQLRQGAHGKGAAFGCLDCGSHRIGPVPLASAS